jgi:hypothetical protein
MVELLGFFGLMCGRSLDLVLLCYVWQKWHRCEQSGYRNRLKFLHTDVQSGLLRVEDSTIGYRSLPRQRTKRF